ncbi:hypothetical protein ABFS82_13G075800 [Erythranthe guttata]|uniref:putative FBD-associated F-box protein At5g56440 n=1 Tax=Erythranthe guttata TaxID=4155 RepID=UPI00064E0C11|nr:PREDICTED: putative FBD-associated F-box protein At5g56440 [Erythranthe guttata]|eukprot:XP_012847652.1 PREDICTED: putative FBD-associated F-box protein At5g56440 [Erythranthe guttata]
MEKKTEQQSRKRRNRSHVGIDRLSSLPDRVLRHILSFLPTKSSVRTSILGQRWRHLWAYVPNLDFDNENQETINRVMLLRKVQTLHTFLLYHKINCSPYQLDTWVTFAILRNVQKLHLYFRYQTALPRCLFTCETLVNLTLDSCGVVPSSGAVRLPRLKTLHLSFVQFEADESLPHLISGCPVLEELVMEFLLDMVHCCISSPTIKFLVFNLVADGRKRVELNTPALGFLEMSDSFSDHIESGALNSLFGADIELHNFDKKRDDVLHSQTVLEFVGRLCNVKRLKLHLAYDISIVDSLLSAWTVSFRNLTELKLVADYRFLLKMLENADNLQVLTFSEYSNEIERAAEPPQQVPTCLLSRLKMVEFGCIAGHAYELEVIRYILRYSKVLERVKIVYGLCIGSEEKINMLQEISLFRRGSTTCEVAFVRYAV